MATLGDILREQGRDGEALPGAAEDPAVERRYRDNTDQAVRAGVFRSPSYVFDGELFWGQDRLDMLDDHIAAG